MSHQRQEQWYRRFRQIQAMRDRFTALGRYDRAYKAHLTIQRAYDLWADEVFAGNCMR